MLVPPRQGSSAPWGGREPAPSPLGETERVTHDQTLTKSTFTPDDGDDALPSQCSRSPRAPCNGSPRRPSSVLEVQTLSQTLAPRQTASRGWAPVSAHVGW